MKMKFKGTLIKMITELKNPVNYILPLGEESVNMNDLIGKPISLTYHHEIFCIRCGRKTNQSFHQGYCYPCFRTAPETDDCVLKPEMCRAHEGISRDMEWSKDHCLTDHIVYLAISSGLKVGVTRISQIPTRWIDQGASYAIKIAQTPNRYLAGLIEVSLKRNFADKTNWRSMLTNKIDTETRLAEQKDRARDLVKKDLQPYFIDDNSIIEIQYPVVEYPQKVNSVSFDKEGVVAGRLMGIKGQYLIFEGGNVLNIRKHNGYVVELEY